MVAEIDRAKVFDWNEIVFLLCVYKARSPNSDSSERSGSGVLDAESSRLDDQDIQFDDERGNDVDEIEERKPYEGISEFAESTMEELLAIYGLAGGELAKSVSRQLPPTFLNPSVGQQAQGECNTPPQFQ